MKGLQSESSSESFTKPLTARMQPITDTLSRGLQTSIVIFDQSRLTSAVSRAFNMHRKHDQPDCSRWKTRLVEERKMPQKNWRVVCEHESVKVAKTKQEATNSSETDFMSFSDAWTLPRRLGLNSNRLPRLYELHILIGDFTDSIYESNQTQICILRGRFARK